MKKIMRTIIEGRMKELLNLIKKGAQVNLIERELALLALDVILAMKQEKGFHKFACNCFLKIDFSIIGTVRKKLSEEARDLLNEMIILDELGEEYGPDLNLIINLTKKIVEKQQSKLVSDARKLVSVG